MGKASTNTGQQPPQPGSSPLQNILGSLKGGGYSQPMPQPQYQSPYQPSFSNSGLGYYRPQFQQPQYTYAYQPNSYVGYGFVPDTWQQQVNSYQQPQYQYQPQQQLNYQSYNPQQTTQQQNEPLASPTTLPSFSFLPSGVQTQPQTTYNFLPQQQTQQPQTQIPQAQQQTAPMYAMQPPQISNQDYYMQYVNDPFRLYGQTGAEGGHVTEDSTIEHYAAGGLASLKAMPGYAKNAAHHRSLTAALRKMYASKAEAAADMRNPDSPLRQMGVTDPNDPILDSAFRSQGMAAGRFIDGPGDGLSDDVPAVINQKQPAALASGEVVVPADVVSDVGNGSSTAGARKIIAHFAKVRQQRHGTRRQPGPFKGKVMPG